LARLSKSVVDGDVDDRRFLITGKGAHLRQKSKPFMSGISMSSRIRSYVFPQQLERDQRIFHGASMEMRPAEREDRSAVRNHVVIHHQDLAHQRFIHRCIARRGEKDSQIIQGHGDRAQVGRGDEVWCFARVRTARLRIRR